MKKLRSKNESEEMEDEAVLLLDQGRLRHAERILKQLLARAENCLAAHFNLARVYRRTKQYQLAVYHGRRTLKISPNERNARLNLGLIYDEKGQDKLAISSYRRELIRNPDSAETLWNLGRLYFRRHRWLQASRCLRRCFQLGLTVEIEDTVDKLGFCYEKLGDVKSYVEVLTSYVRMFPRAAWAFANLGRASLIAKDYRGAVLSLSRAIELGARSVTSSELTRAKELLLSKRKRVGS